LLRLALLRLAPVRVLACKVPAREVVPSKPNPLQMVGQVAGGAIELRCREVRPAKISPSYDGVREVGVGQRGGIEVALVRLAVRSAWRNKVGTVRFWLAKFQPVRSFPFQTNPCNRVPGRPAKISPSHDGIREVGVGQRGGRKVGTGEVVACKVPARQVFPPKPIPCKIVGQVAGGAIELRCRELE